MPVRNDRQRVPLIRPQGIFKPAVLPEIPLSIATVPPHDGRPPPYADGFDAQTGLLNYCYRGTDPEQLQMGREALAAEWEKAACGTEAPQYPWGNEEFNPNQRQANISGIADHPGTGGTTPVGSFRKDGAVDMAGNVWEWVSDKSVTAGCVAARGTTIRGARVPPPVPRPRRTCDPTMSVSGVPSSSFLRAGLWSLVSAGPGE